MLGRAGWSLVTKAILKEESGTLILKVISLLVTNARYGGGRTQEITMCCCILEYMY